MSELFKIVITKKISVCTFLQWQHFLYWCSLKDVISAEDGPVMTPSCYKLLMWSPSPVLLQFGSLTKTHPNCVLSSRDPSWSKRILLCHLVAHPLILIFFFLTNNQHSVTFSQYLNLQFWEMLYIIHSLVLWLWPVVVTAIPAYITHFLAVRL